MRSLVLLSLLAGCAQADEGPFTLPQALLPDGNAAARIMDSDGTHYNGLGVGTDGALYLAVGEYRLKEEVEDIDQSKFEGVDLLYTELTVEPTLDSSDELTALTFVMGAKDFDASFDGVGFQLDCFEMDPPDDLDKYGVYWELVGKLEDGTVLDVTFSGTEDSIVATGIVDGATIDLKGSVAVKGVERITFSK